MKAYFTTKKWYKEKKKFYKPYKPFNVEPDEVEAVRNLGGFLVGAEIPKSAPTSSVEPVEITTDDIPATASIETKKKPAVKKGKDSPKEGE